MPLTEFQQTSGEPLDAAPPTAPAAKELFAVLPLRAVAPSTTNPRQHFDDAKLQELADSIRASGVHQPILVRPLPGHRVHSTDRAVQYEIVSGERRYRASGLAGATTIPAMVRALSDDQVLEIQIVENLQRTDLTELEEAEGYDRLMTTAGLSLADVAAKIGKSKSYVHTRTKLLDLCVEARKALREGKVDASKALAIARIPDGKLQIKALAEASRRTHLDEPISYREFARWLQQNVMLQLDAARFKITDATLVPAAGSCKECPKRTGANPDLFADVSGKDVCTDPACFHAKEDAHRAQLVAQAEAKGLRVIEGKEAKEIVNQYGSSLNGYSRLDARRHDALSHADAEGDKAPPTLRKLLGKDGPAKVLIEHPWTKELIEAVPTAEAEALLVAKGAIERVTGRGHKESAEHQIGVLKEKLEARVRAEAHKTLFNLVVAQVHQHKDDKVMRLLTEDVLRAVLLSELETREEADMAQALQLPPPHEVDDDSEDNSGQDRYTLAIQRAPLLVLQKALLVLLLQNDAPPTYGAMYYYARANVPDTPILNAAAAKVGLSPADIEGEVRERVKAEVDAEIKAIKAKAAADAKAQATADGKAAKDTPQAPSKSPATRKPKATAKATATEAAQAIASALQQAEAAAPVAMAIGVNVTVKDSSALQLKLQKWAGKKGTITHCVGDRAWTVTFKGRSGGMATFDVSELEMAA